MMANIPLRRSIAFLIDMFVVNIIVSFVANLFPVTIPIHHFEIFRVQFTTGITLVPVFYGLYFVAFDMINNGQTIGKLIAGILTVSKNGKKLSTKRCLLRSWYKMFGILILPVSVLLFLFKDYYTIQDRYANTVTIQK